MQRPALLLALVAASVAYRICFHESEQSSQCQWPAGRPADGVTCSGDASLANPTPDWTQDFRDDTDNREGGCQYQWIVDDPTGTSAITAGVQYRLCFRELEGSSQCQGTRASCSSWTANGGSREWTSGFRDDTDNRDGGCQYEWRIEARASSTAPAPGVCKVCFQESEGSSQCQYSRASCSSSSSWTQVFRDDTDGRSGGCSYTWLLECDNEELIYPPTITKNELDLVEGQVANVYGSIQATDADSSFDQLVYTVVSVEHGFFAEDDNQSVEISTFTQLDIQSGSIVFVNDGGKIAPSYTLSLTDGTTTVTSVGTVVYTLLNLQPSIVSNGFSATEGIVTQLSSNDINSSDADSSPSQLTYTVVSVSHGYFAESDNQSDPISTFTQSDIDSGSVVFVNDGGKVTPTYTLVLSDGNSTTDPSDGTVIYTLDNMPPKFVLNTIYVREGVASVLSASNIYVTDVDNSSSELVFSVTAVSNGFFAYVTSVSSPTTTFTMADIELQSVVFIPTGEVSVYIYHDATPSYSLSVFDGKNSVSSDGIVVYTPVCKRICKYSFASPQVPSFSWNSSTVVDSTLNTNNPITLSNQSSLAQGCNGNTLQYLSDDGTWLSSYTDKNGQTRSEINIFYVSGWDLKARTVQTWQSNLFDLLKGRLLKLTAVCNNGESSCIVFKIAPAVEESLICPV